MNSITWTMIGAGGVLGLIFTICTMIVVLTFCRCVGATEQVVTDNSPTVSISEIHSGEERFEPLTQAQVEILVDGRNLDKDYRRYLKRKDQYLSFVDYEYEMSVRRYHSGKRKIRSGRILMVTSTIPIGLGFAMLGVNAKNADDDDEDSGDFDGLGDLFGGAIILAGTGLLVTGAALVARGNFLKIVWGKAADRLHPYADYYQRYPQRPIKLAGAGFFATPTSVAAGASFTF